jgi:hypothetical protein
VRGIACTAVGGYIAKHLKIVNFDLPRIVKWMTAQCQPRVRSKLELSASASAIQVLTRFLDNSVGERLVVNAPFTPFQTNVVHIRPSSGRLSVRFELTGKRYTIANHVWHEWCTEHGQSSRAVLDTLMQQKVVLDKRKRCTLGAGTEYEGGQIWCFIVDGRHELMTGMVPDLTNVVALKPAAPHSPPSSDGSVLPPQG